MTYRHFGELDTFLDGLEARTQNLADRLATLERALAERETPSGPVGEEHRTDPNVARLGSVLIDHQERYRQAVGSRGKMPTASPPLVTHRLQELHRDGLPDSIVLIYQFRPPVFEIFLLEGRGTGIGYSRSDLSEETLLEASSGLRAALGVDALVADRSPRGVPPFATSDSTPSVSAAVAELSRMVLPPSLGAKLEAYEQIVVVPVGALATLPFALLCPEDSGAPLVESVSVSVAPSIEDLVTQLERNAGLPVAPGNGRRDRCYFLSSRQPLVVGNPKYSPGLQRLPGAQREAETVAGFLGGQALVDTDASLHAVCERLGSSDLIYFATHGAADPDDPLDGGVLHFCGTEKLSAREIQSMHLGPADLVVLSACQTGLGKTHDAGVLGLARAFVLAGAGAVVMSLWNVDDDATTSLMTTFLRTLVAEAEEGSPAFPAEALRQAMLATRLEHPLPSHWGAFVHYGTPWP